MSNSEDFQDTGMTSVFYQGVNSERERILQIIEDYRYKPSFTFANLISLIKGQQK